MRPRKVASRKVVARYGYVENARVSPAEAGHLIAVQAKQQNVIFICHLYILDGNGVPEHLVVTIAYFQPFHGSPGFDKLRGDIRQVAGEGDMVPRCSYRLPETLLDMESITIELTTRVARSQASQPIAELIGDRRGQPGEWTFR